MFHCPKDRLLQVIGAVRGRCKAEERLDTKGEVTLLQVGHHGSLTSTGRSFIDKVKPKYAVVSCAKQDEGTNSGFCHPRTATIERLTAATGGPGEGKVTAFDSEVSCRNAPVWHWQQVATSNRMWITARDGTVVLSTTGDGVFKRE